MPKHKLISLFKDLKDANLVTTNEMGHFGISEDHFTAVDIAPPVVNTVRPAVQQDIGHLTASSSNHKNTATI